MPELFTPTHLMFLGILPAIVIVVPFWQIFRKAGLPAPLALLMVIPIVNIVMLYVVAFRSWSPTSRFASTVPDGRQL